MRLQHSEMADRPARCDALRGGDDGVGVDAVVPVKVRDRAGLAEMLDPERPHAMAVDRAEPGEGCGVSVEHRDDAAVRRQIAEESLDVRAGMDEPAIAGAQRRGPAGVEPVGRSHCQQADVTTILRHQPDRLDRLRRHRAGVRHHDLAVRPGLAQPVGAIDDALAQLGRHCALDLLDWARR